MHLPASSNPARRESAAHMAQIVAATKSLHDIRVRRWRTSMTGCAWRVYHHDGRVVNWIESPRPRTPISLAIFLHEVGHHVIGFERYKKRCEEEYHVWLWALREMDRLGIPADARVQRRFQLSMQYAVAKALRRGLKNLPAPLAAFAAQQPSPQQTQPSLPRAA
jgi:hypothetical protein